MNQGAGLALAAGVAALTAWQLGALLTRAGEESVGRLRAVAGAIAFAFAVAVGILAVPAEGRVPHGARVVLMAGTLVLLTGLWRDVGRGFRGLALGALTLAAAAVVAWGGARITTIKIPFLAGDWPFLELGAAGPLLTVAWIVVVAVLVRATDPLPGLTAGLGACAAATFLVVALTRGRESLADVSSLTPHLAAVTLGACLGLLTPGLGPRALSMGRGGAGLLGFLLGVLTVIGTLKHTAFLLIALPLLSLAVPVLNLLYQRGSSRSVSAMLSGRGFTHRRTVGLLLALQVYCCLTALALVGMITISVVVKVLLLALLLPAAFAAFFLISRIAAQVATAGEAKVEILGVPLDPLTYETAVERMDGFIRAGTPHHVFTADVSGIMRARGEPELLEIIRTCDLVTADGAGVLWAARIFDLPLPERVSGVDLVRRLSGLAAERGYRVFLLGAAPGVAEQAAEVLRRENPGLDIVGILHGYFEAEQEVVEALRRAQPQILFVALGIPRQERFIRRWYRELNLPLCLGIGGSFDVISGKLQRAPGWMQRAGLEWLYRTVQEPKRFRRLAALPRFVWAIAWESWRAWRRGEQDPA